MKKILAVLVSALLLATLAAGACADAKVTLSLSHQMAASHSINETALKFAELVAEKSGGEMAIDVYPSATLGTETENLQALTNGTLDCAIIAAEFYANYVDEAGILCLPSCMTATTTPMRSFTARRARPSAT